MRLVPTHPRAIVSFNYDATARTLSAYHADGKVTICSDVPAAMFHVLERTLTPEEFFIGYIATQFACERVRAKTTKVEAR